MKKKMPPLPYALYLLKIRDRGTQELRQKMVRKEYSPAEIEEAIKFLSEKNFLDDERFVENFVKNELIFHSGKYRIKQKLLKLSLPHEVIEKYLSGISNTEEEKSAQELAESWLRKKDKDNKIASDAKLREKFARHLMSRGFNWEIVKEILDKL